MKTFITATASFLPNAPVPSEEIERVLGMVAGRPSRTRARVLRSNGIRTRYYAVDPATGKATHNNAQLTAEAVRALARKAHFDIGRDLPLLACGTGTPDQWIPNHASMVHGELGSPPCEVMSASGACNASMAALKYAALAVAAGEAPRAIATGSERPSQLMRSNHFEPEMDERVQALEEHPRLAFEHEFLRWMLSDGAGAVLLEAEPNRRRDNPVARIDWIEYVSFAGEMETCMYHGARKEGSVLRSWYDVADPRDRVRGGYFNLGQDSRLLAEHIGTTMAKALASTLAKHPLRPDDVDWFLPHYSSEFFRPEVEKQIASVGLPIPRERIFTNLVEKGNTGAASIFIMLDELFSSGRAKPGQRILCFVPESARFSVSYMLLSIAPP